MNDTRLFQVLRLVREHQRHTMRELQKAKQGNKIMERKLDCLGHLDDVRTALRSLSEEVARLVDRVATMERHQALRSHRLRNLHRRVIVLTSKVQCRIESQPRQ